MNRWFVSTAAVALFGTALARGQAATVQDPGHLQVANQSLEAAARLNPSDPETHARLGMAYRRAGMPGRAAEALERAIALDPNPRVRVLLAFSYADAGRCQDAVAHLEACFDTEPKDSVR